VYFLAMTKPPAVVIFYNKRFFLSLSIFRGVV